ncbi:MAG: ankyrin repeat domain-containing protein [Parachlamydia sp.]|nr:ankyrin repeat domain-containing protein [Parachlamydia sp.]
MHFIGWLPGWGSKPKPTPLPPSPLDKWARQILGDKNNSELRKAYFCAGGTSDRIDHVAKESGLTLDSADRNQMRNLESIQPSLAGKVIQDLLMKGAGTTQDGETAQILLDAPDGFEKVVRQFRMIFEGIQICQQVQKQELTDQLEKFAARLDGKRVEETLRREFAGQDRMLNEILFAAINNGNVALVSKLIKPEQFTTALLLAVRSGQQQIIELLVSLGAELKPNLMHEAVLAGQIHLMPYFKEKGFDLMMMDDAGMTPFSIAAGMDDTTMFAELQRLQPEVKAEIPRFFFEQQMMCHRFGLREIFRTSGNREIKLQGLYSGMAEKQMLKSFENFCDLSENMPGIDLDAILSVLKKENDADIGFCNAGWDTHAAYFVYSKSQQLLIKCNRGNGSEGSPGLKIYRIKKIANLPDAISLASHMRDKKQGLEFYNKTLDALLDLEAMDPISHKEQHTGNCSWASAKLLIKAILLLQLLKKSPRAAAESQSQQLYKTWTAYDRSEAIDAFIESLERMKQDGIPCREEDGLIPEKILASVFFKCLRKGFEKHLPAIIGACPEVLKKDPLSAIVEQGLLDCIPLCISQDPKVNDANQEGARMALLAASEADKEDLVRLLLDKVIDVNAGIKSAVEEGDLQMLSVFLKHARDQVAQKISGRPLPESALDAIKLLSLLREHHVTLDPALLQNRGLELLFTALMFRGEEQAAMLLRYPGLKIDVMRKERFSEDKNWNALMFACEAENEPMIQLILDYCRLHHIAVQPDQDWTEQMKNNLEAVRKMSKVD